MNQDVQGSYGLQCFMFCLINQEDTLIGERLHLVDSTFQLQEIAEIDCLG